MLHVTLVLVILEMVKSTNILVALYTEDAGSIKDLLTRPDTIVKGFETLSICQACNRGDLQIVKHLVEDGRFDIYAGGDYTPLMQAARGGHLDVLKYLLEFPKMPANAANNRCIRAAASAGRKEIVKYLLTFDEVDPSASDNEALISAVRNAFVDVVKLLVGDRRVDPTKCNYLAFRLAIKKGYFRLVYAMITHHLVDISVVQGLLFKVINPVAKRILQHCSDFERLGWEKIDFPHPTITSLDKAAALAIAFHDAGLYESDLLTTLYHLLPFIASIKNPYFLSSIIACLGNDIDRTPLIKFLSSQYLASKNDEDKDTLKHIKILMQ